MQIPFRSPDTLRCILRTGIYQNFGGCHNILRVFTPEEEKRYIRRPRMEDADPGPERIWRWTHMETAPPDFAYAGQHFAKREQGYVLWDWARVERVFDLSVPYVAPGWPRRSIYARRMRVYASVLR